MRKLPEPSLNVVAVYTTCISKVKDPNLKSKLTLCASFINNANDIYERAAKGQNLNTINAHDSINGTVTKSEMIKVYTGRMVPKKAPGRTFYDKLLTSAPHGRCPLCGHRIVTTLDHILPKSHYPVYSVAPINLVPACKDCNISKEDVIPSSKEDVIIHPYFDDIESDLWLKAKVIESQPVVISFYVEKPTNWDNTKHLRVKNHFSVLGLSILYTSQSAEELINIRYSLETLYAKGGKVAVKNYLIDAANSRTAAYLNSWQSAMYTALCNSEWFCDGGFNLT